MKEDLDVAVAENRLDLSEGTEYDVQLSTREALVRNLQTKIAQIFHRIAII